MVDFEQALVQLLRDFTAKVAVLVRQTAIESASAALGPVTGGASGAVRSGRRPSPRPSKSARRPPAKREPFDAEAAGPQVVSYLLAHPGLRMDELGQRLQLPTTGLKPLVKKLVVGRLLRAEGNTRGRRYFAAKRATSATDARRKAKPGRKAKRGGKGGKKS